MNWLTNMRPEELFRFSPQTRRRYLKLTGILGIFFGLGLAALGVAIVFAGWEIAEYFGLFVVKVAICVAK